MSLELGPCAPWATSADLCPPCSDNAEDSELIERSIEIASEVLFVLSGRQFPGECESTIRPCARPYSSNPMPPRAVEPYYPRGWFCRCAGGCHCLGYRSLRLPFGPVRAITSVKVDGVTLDTSAYRVDDYVDLIRLDGEAWPSSQDMILETTEVNTFEVEYTWGSAVPASGVHAAAVLACELIQSCNPGGADKCRLPRRVTQITRNGLTMVALDPFSFLENGKTGIYECDLFLESFNPTQSRRPSIVWSPDIGTPYTQAGT